MMVAAKSELSGGRLAGSMTSPSDPGASLIPPLTRTFSHSLSFLTSRVGPESTRIRMLAVVTAQMRIRKPMSQRTRCLFLVAMGSPVRTPIH